MAIQLGKDVVSSYTGISNDNIRNVSITDEAETIDISARGHQGYKAFETSFSARTVEIECLAHSLSVDSKVGSLIVTSITTNEPLDDVVTYNITLRPTDPSA